MKKLFFSVLTLVTFTVNANDFTEVKNQEKSKVEEQIDCNVERFKAYTQARNDGFSHEDASSLSYAIYFNCLSVTGPSKPIDSIN